MVPGRWQLRRETHVGQLSLDEHPGSDSSAMFGGKFCNATEICCASQTCDDATYWSTEQGIQFSSD